MGFLRRLLGGTKRPKPPEPPAWPRSTVVADGLDHPRAIAVGATHIWFGTGGFLGADNSIRRVALTGGPTEVIATSGGIPSDFLVLHDDLVVWTDEFGADSRGEVLTAPAAGGAVTRLVTDAPSPRELVVDGGHVYYVASGLRRYRNDDDGDIARVPIAGGEVERLATGQTTANQLVVNNGYAWWCSPDGVLRVPVEGGAIEEVHHCGEDFVAGPMAADGTHLYVVLSDLGVETLHRIPIGGGPPEQILDDRLAGPFPMHVDGDHVYWWGKAGSTYRLCRSPKAGGATEELDRGEITSGPFVVAHGAVWWTDISSVRRTQANSTQ